MMGYVPPNVPASLYTIAQVMDVGAQFLHVGDRKRAGLPRTFEEYVAALYGARSADHQAALGWLLVAASIALAFAVLALLLGF